MRLPYHLEVSVIEASMTVALNGIPLFASPDNTGYAAGGDVTLWIKPDLNVLTIRLFDPVEESRVQADARLFLPDPAEEVALVGTLLAEFDWPPVFEDPATPIPRLPHTASVSLNVTAPPPTLLWSQAVPRVELTDADRQAMLSVTEAVRQRLMARDVAGAMPFLEYKVQEDARATGKTPDEIRAIAVDLFEWMVENPLQSQPLNPAEAEFTVLAGGRLVLVGRPGGAPALQFHDNLRQETYSFRLFFSYVGGSWRIVR